MSKKEKKKRNWACVIYPESAPENWREVLQLKGLQCAISPLHDKDVNPDGEIKKAHYHVILAYSGPTSFSVVKAITDELNQPIPQPLEQVRGYYRYFTHKDNPEKAQYSDLEITTINGFCISDFIELSQGEVAKIKKNLQCLIRDLNILEYAQLLDYLLDNCMDLELEVASNHTLFFDRYLTSRRHEFLRSYPQSPSHSCHFLVNECTEKCVEKGKLCDENGLISDENEMMCDENEMMCGMKRCVFCGSLELVKNGKNAGGKQVFRCNTCGKRSTKVHE